MKELHVDSLAASQEKALMRMGLNTALAITLHNFPEGRAACYAEACGLRFRYLADLGLRPWGFPRIKSHT